MTLLELTVVILVLISLITILFIGVSSWKKGADRSANILNIRNVQQAARAHANSRGLNFNSPLDSSEIVGTDRYLSIVEEPNGAITYDYGTTVPPLGTLYLIATYSDAEASTDYAPTSGSYSDW